MAKKVTFGQVRRLLGEFGFEEMPHQEPHVVFEHKPSDTLLFFRPHRLREEVDPMTLSIVRKTLDWKGFVKEDGFEEAIRKASTNGISRVGRKQRQKEPAGRRSDPSTNPDNGR